MWPKLCKDIHIVACYASEVVTTHNNKTKPCDEKAKTRLDNVKKDDADDDDDENNEFYCFYCCCRAPPPADGPIVILLGSMLLP